jgi:2-oxoglutarate dehydrogenase E1 component
LNDGEAMKTADSNRRLILCSGKVCVDLHSVQETIKEAGLQVAVVRLEQLYPFPQEQLQTILDGYPKLTELVWVQEEPANMGAWSYLRFRLDEVLDGRLPLRYIGRPRRASPAEGSAAWHGQNQQAIVQYAFKFE